MNLGKVDWSIVSAIVQSIMAITSAVIACFVYRQSERFNKQEKKIAELTEITRELAKQTDELKKQSGIHASRLRVEKEASKLLRMPYFTPVELRISDNKEFVIVRIKNIGIACLSLNVHDSSSNILEFNVPRPMAYKDEVIDIWIRMPSKEPKDNIKFTITFKSELGSMYSQLYTKMFRTEAHLTPPED